MTKSNKPVRRSECPISFGLDLFGDKWTLLILRDILLFGKTRFSDFAVPEGIATNVLSNRLARLEQAGIITKKRDETLKNQNIYLSTEEGRSLTPALVELMLWGIRYDQQTPVNKSFIRRLTAERDEITQQIATAVHAGEFEEYRAKEMGVDANLYARRS